MIYLDNAATTKPSEAACRAMMSVAEHFGNPSSLHGIGFAAEKLVTAARKTLAESVGAKNVYFTSGGTEANNFAIFGAADALKRVGNRVIVSAIEHPSVLEAAKKLERDGYDVAFADVDADGRVNVEKFREILTDKTVLVSVMHVNNETGVIQPVRELAKIARAVSPRCMIHCDCVQSFGKIPVNISRLGADMITISAHKIHGFKGCGALCTAGVRITPLIYGGEQQNEVRPGTENVGGILAFAAAARECDPESGKLKELRAMMRARIAELSSTARFNGSDEHNSGSVLNVSFPGIKAEILLHSLESREIYVSTGSACSSHKPQPSHVLTAMGCPTENIRGAIRISFSAVTTPEEVLEAADVITAEAKKIKAVMSGHRSR